MSRSNSGQLVVRNPSLSPKPSPSHAIVHSESRSSISTTSTTIQEAIEEKPNQKSCGYIVCRTLSVGLFIFIIAAAQIITMVSGRIYATVKTLSDFKDPTLTRDMVWLALAASSLLASIRLPGIYFDTIDEKKNPCARFQRLSKKLKKCCTTSKKSCSCFKVKEALPEPEPEKKSCCYYLKRFFYYLKRFFIIVGFAALIGIYALIPISYLAMVINIAGLGNKAFYTFRQLFNNEELTTFIKPEERIRFEIGLAITSMVFQTIRFSYNNIPSLLPNLNIAWGVLQGKRKIICGPKPPEPQSSLSTSNFLNKKQKKDKNLYINPSNLCYRSSNYVCINVFFTTLKTLLALLFLAVLITQIAYTYLNAYFSTQGGVEGFPLFTISGGFKDFMTEGSPYAALFSGLLNTIDSVLKLQLFFKKIFDLKTGWAYAFFFAVILIGLADAPASEMNIYSSTLSKANVWFPRGEYNGTKINYSLHDWTVTSNWSERDMQVHGIVSSLSFLILMGSFAWDAGQGAINAINGFLNYRKKQEKAQQKKKTQAEQGDIEAPLPVVSSQPNTNTIKNPGCCSRFSIFSLCKSSEESRPLLSATPT